MRILGRRQFLAYLAASAAYLGRAEGFQQNETFRSRTNCRDGTWFLGRQKTTSDADCGIDFWSKPYCAFDYADRLPPEISRGVLWYDDQPFDPDDPHPSLRHVDLLFTGTQNNWMNDPRLFVAYRGTPEDFPRAIKAFVGEKDRYGYRKKTALLALNSQSLANPDPDWAEMLPAFRRCYDLIIDI